MKHLLAARNLLATCALCLIAGAYSAPAATAVVLIDGSKCSRTDDPAGYYFYDCYLGRMPYGTGYNSVIPSFYKSAHHSVTCWLVLFNPDAFYRTPSGYTTGFPTWYAGNRTAVTLFYQWEADLYAGGTGRFQCMESRNGSYPDPELEIVGIYTLRV